MNVMGSRLCNTSSSNMIIILVDGILHLLQELVDVDQVVLRADVAHWGEMVDRRTVSTRAVATTHGHGRWHGLVFRHRATGQDRERQILKTKEALANRCVRVKIELTAFQIAKELVQSIVAPLLGFIRSMAVVTVVESIVYVSIGRIGRLVWGMRRIVLWSTVGVSLAGHCIQRWLEIMGGSSITFSSSMKHHIRISGSRLRRPHKHGVIGMGLHVFLEILGTLECFPTEFTFMRLQRNVDTDVRRDMVTLNSRGAAASPLACQIEVICALSTDVTLADVIIK
jgi:hypothetical protein